MGPQGLAGGQLPRLAASAVAPNPCVATLSFAGHFGNPVGPAIPVDLSPGHAQELDLDASVLGLQAGQRAEVQPIVMLHTPVNSAASSSQFRVLSQLPTLTKWRHWDLSSDRDAAVARRLALQL